MTVTENGKPCTSIHPDGHTYCDLRAGHVTGHFGGGKVWWDKRVAPATVTPTRREAELERQFDAVTAERDRLRYLLQRARPCLDIVAIVADDDEDACGEIVADIDAALADDGSSSGGKDGG